jgi:hypothetical protein
MDVAGLGGGERIGVRMSANSSSIDMVKLIFRSPLGPTAATPPIVGSAPLGSNMEQEKWGPVEAERPTRRFSTS